MSFSSQCSVQSTPHHHYETQTLTRYKIQIYIPKASPKLKSRWSPFPTSSSTAGMTCPRWASASGRLTPRSLPTRSTRPSRPATVCSTAHAVSSSTYRAVLPSTLTFSRCGNKTGSTRKRASQPAVQGSPADEQQCDAVCEAAPWKEGHARD